MPRMNGARVPEVGWINGLSRERAVVDEALDLHQGGFKNAVVEDGTARDFRQMYLYDAYHEMKEMKDQLMQRRMMLGRAISWSVFISFRGTTCDLG